MKFYTYLKLQSFFTIRKCVIGVKLQVVIINEFYPWKPFKTFINSLRTSKFLFLVNNDLTRKQTKNVFNQPLTTSSLNLNHYLPPHFYIITELSIIFFFFEKLQNDNLITRIMKSHHRIVLSKSKNH